MSEWVIRLPWTKPPISANDRLHWRARADKVRQIRTAVQVAVALSEYSTNPMPFDAERITVGLVYTPRDKRRRDADNLFPLYKAAVDGLVSGRLIPDDDDKHVTREMPRIAEPDGDPRIELIIRT